MTVYTSILLLNIIAYYALKMKGLLKSDEGEPQMNTYQFNTVAKNPKVIKEVIFFGIGIFIFTVSGICQGLIVQVPQSFDKTLAIYLFLLMCFGFVMPFLIWISNERIQKHSIREFWDVAPLWLVDLKCNYFSQDVEKERTIELHTISHSINLDLQRGSSRDE